MRTIPPFCSLDPTGRATRQSKSLCSDVPIGGDWRRRESMNEKCNVSPRTDDKYREDIMENTNNLELGRVYMMKGDSTWYKNIRVNRRDLDYRSGYSGQG
ncbi:hypothetical protein AcV5_003315 [Taiwanofungus camphoratus]|nr:hypothetical protein AcV5_003315 [Antrodia cinnamomea]